MPEAVCAGLNDPHEALGAQLQVTPLFAESLDTVAVMLAVALVCVEEGGAVVMATEIAVAVIVTLAVALFVVSLTAVAVMVTLLP